MMLTALDQAIEKAFKSEGKKEDVSQVYLTFLRTTLFVPVKKSHIPTAEEPFLPLVARVHDNLFMLVFDEVEKIKNWAGEKLEEMNYVEMTGDDLLDGINQGVYLSLNVGAPFHKEFPPEEIDQLKMLLFKVRQLK